MFVHSQASRTPANGTQRYDRPVRESRSRRNRNGMRRVAVGLAACSALALSVATAVPAMAATSGNSGTVPAITHITRGATPDVPDSRATTVQLGGSYYVKIGVKNVTKGYRLALESYVQPSREAKKQWVVRGSWPLKPGTKTFVGRAIANVTGTYTLRVQFMRNGKLIPKDYSGSAQLKVIGKKPPKVSKPKIAPGLATARAAATPNGVVADSDWTSVTCASFDTLGHGVDIPSPYTQAIAGTGYVDQLLLTAKWQPATRSWGPWQYVSVPVQEITQPDPNVITVNGSLTSNTASNELSAMLMDFSGDPDEYHTFAWNIAAWVNGSWKVANSSWLMPGSYLQWPSPIATIVPFTTSTCETFAHQT